MHSRKILIALGGMLAAFSTAQADLTTNLAAYYDFEQTGAPGLANKAPGATGFHATRGGTLHTDWATGPDPTGPGFAGKVDFTGISGTSDRSDLHTGNALNLDDDRDEYVEIPVGTAQLGSSFTISAWHALTPGALNASNRYHVFEASNGFDISWGTANTSFTAPQAAYQYLGYVGEGAGMGPGGILTGVWHHVMHSFSSDGTTTTLRLYVDGQAAGTRTAPTSAMDFPSILLGRHRTTAAQDREWDGMIDEVAVWNRALSATDASELFLRGVEGFTLNGDLAAGNKGFVGVSGSPPEGGTVGGTELYTIGDVANISAEPAIGYLFNGWSAPFTGQEIAFDHNVTGSVYAVANFVQDGADDDSDGLTNYEELVVHFTVPNDPDTDADGIEDGDEVLHSQTSPLVSQEAAITYILANLCTGGVSPGDVVINRNAGNNTLSFRLTAEASGTLGGWSAILPASPGTSGTANAGSFRLMLSGTAGSKRFFRFEGLAP